MGSMAHLGWRGSACVALASGACVAQALAASPVAAAGPAFTNPAAAHYPGGRLAPGAGSSVETFGTGSFNAGEPTVVVVLVWRRRHRRYP